MGFDRQTSLINRDNTRASWEYQSQMTALNNSWSMEDIDENIRRSSGRERSLLIRQKDRMATTQNLELGETDRQRKSQEDMWKREDERYKKQEEYIKLTQKFEDEAFKRGQSQREALYKMDSDDLNRRLEEAKASHILQLEAQQLQRDFQTAEIERSKEALGIQQQQNDAQYQYNKNMETMQKGQRDMLAVYDKMFSSAAGMKQMADSLIAISRLRFTLKVTPTGATFTSNTIIEKERSVPK